MDICKTNSGNAIYTAIPYARQCGGEFLPFCGIDNVVVTADNTETLKKTSQDGCTISNLQKTTSTITFDMYNFSVEHLDLIFNGDSGKTSSTPVIGDVYTLNNGQWTASATEDTFYYFPNRNADNTLVNVTNVEASVDGTSLVEGVDYKIELEELCNADGSKYNKSKVVIIAAAPNITTDEQDLMFTYDYTAKEEAYFNLKIGSSVAKKIELMLIATNKSDPTDQKVIIAVGTFTFSGNIFEFNFDADTLTEPTASNISFTLDNNTELQILGMDEFASCCSSDCV